HHHRKANEPADRHEIAQEIELEMMIEGGVDAVRGADQEQGVAIRRSARYCLCGDRAARAVAVIDKEGLAKPPRQPVGGEPCNHIRSTAGNAADDDPHRPSRIIKRASARAQYRHRGADCGEVEKASAAEMHKTLQSRRSRRVQSSLILAKATTLAHFSVSAAISF